MQVTGLEVERNPRLRGVRGGILLVHGPLAAERPFVQRQLLRHRVVVRDAGYLAARRGEVLRARMADIRLGTQYVHLIGR
jgi:hypothetical protein